MGKFGQSLKHHPEVIELISKYLELDKETGGLKLLGAYASLVVNVSWRGKALPIPYSHIVWFKTYGVWPQDGYNIDHINDDPFDNRPCNLQELSVTANCRKKRGRIVNRNYGTGKCGHGIYIHHDKRDGRYYVTRNLPRGITSSDTTINYGLGGYDSAEEAESRVEEVIELIKIHGDSYLPPKPALSKKKKTTFKYNRISEEMKALRQSGLTIREVADKLGLKPGVVYRRIRNIDIDCRSRERSPEHSTSKLMANQVLEIRDRYKKGDPGSLLAKEYGVSKSLIHQIVNGEAWRNVKE